MRWAVLWSTFCVVLIAVSSWFFMIVGHLRSIGRKKRKGDGRNSSLNAWSDRGSLVPKAHRNWATIAQV